MVTGKSRSAWAEREHGYSHPDETGFTLRTELGGANFTHRCHHGHANETHLRIRRLPDDEPIQTLDQLVARLFAENILFDSALIRLYGIQVTDAVRVEKTLQWPWTISSTWRETQNRADMYSSVSSWVPILFSEMSKNECTRFFCVRTCFLCPHMFFVPAHVFLCPGIRTNLFVPGDSDQSFLPGA